MYKRLDHNWGVCSLVQGIQFGLPCSFCRLLRLTSKLQLMFTPLVPPNQAGHDQGTNHPGFQQFLSGQAECQRCQFVFALEI